LPSKVSGSFDQASDHASVEIRRQGVVQRHLQRPLPWHLQRFDLFFHLSRGDQHFVDVGRELRALRRQRQAFVGTAKQAETELLFDLVQLCGQRLHGQARMLGCSRQRAGLHDAHEVA
jgi:hypothetical protein